MIAKLSPNKYRRNKPLGSRDYGIDILKAVSAFFVVLIHSYWDLTYLDISFAKSVSAVSRIGVGCFFVITGYYFPVMYKNRKVSGFLLRNVKLALWSCLLYFIFNLVYYKIVWNNFNSYLNRFSGESLWKFLFFNFSYPEFHLWYLFAVIYTVALVLLFYNFKKKKAMYIISFLLLIVGLTASYIDTDVIWHRNWAFYGLPFVAMGVLIRENSAILHKINSKIILVVLALCVASFIGEVLLLDVNREYYILTVIASACLLILAVRFEGSRLPHRSRFTLFFISIGAQYSMYIYIFHIAIKKAFDLLLAYYGDNDVVILLVSPVIIYFLSCVVSYLWLRLPYRPF